MSKRYPGGVIRQTPDTPTQASATGVWNMTDVTQAQQTNNWPVANVPNPMSRSLRFRSSASAYLNRTPATASNRKTWTWSAWVKLGAIPTDTTFFAARTASGGTYLTIGVTSASDFRIQSNSETSYPFLKTNALFRDPSAWYHFVVAMDTTQATSTNRAKVWVNGVAQTFASYNVPAQNTDLAVNSTETHLIGQQASGSYFDGYMAEVNFVDGQALTATSFGQYDQFSNWTSKQYTGTYGTNGFYLPFKNNSSTGTLGLDFSGNNNTWTTNNFSVTPSYQYTTYTSGSGTYTVPSNVTSIQYLVVGGGGGGGNRSGGGGGAGGLIQGSMAVTPGQTIAYSIGTGGTGGAASGGTNNNGTNGSNTTFGALTAIGGGAGATPGDGIAGGSGGGAGHGGGPGGAGTVGQGSTGGTGASAFAGSGGGGGAGAMGGSYSGNSGGAGGAGLTWINGTTYAGGGGGGARTDVGGSPGAGGAGGGGAGNNPGVNGTANTGGGGGGGNYTGTGQAGGNGGSGVVIVAYATGNATYDSMTDVPTQWTPYNVTGDVGGIIRGNYATLNPLMFRLSNTPGATITNGNLTATHTPSAYGSYVFSTIAGYGNKFYYEMTATSVIGGMSVGIDGGLGVNSSEAARVTYQNSGLKRVNGTASSYGESYTSGDIIGVALDLVSGSITFYKNGVSQGVASSSIGTNPYFAFGESDTGSVANWNFGQYAFTYAPPSGYKSLCTTNLPTPTIQQGNLVMDVNLWTGNSGTQAITNSGAMKPDFIWIKGRNQAYYHCLQDSLRGVAGTLFSNDTAAEETNQPRLSSFNSNGFTLTSKNDANNSGDTYVGWQWQAGQGTTSNITVGQYSTSPNVPSIASTVSVNPTAGFSIVTYTGNGSAGATVGHGLGAAAKMVIVKERSNANVWGVGSSSLTSWAYHVRLNATNAESNADNFWNSTAPTSSVFTLGDVTAVNRSGGTYVAYCWSEVAGFSKFGSYTGNGSTDGAFVYLGFRPKLIMIKSTGNNDWWFEDTSRSTYNVMQNLLYPNSSNAESVSSSNNIDALSNGFKLRTTDGAVNTSSQTYIYMAFAEYPFKSALAR